MIQSMTGYSRHEAETAFGKLIIEIKSWNHRYCNVTVRLPDLLSRFEHRIQSIIRNRVSRGQLHALIELARDTSSSNQLPVLDFALAKQYHQKLVQLQNELHLQGEISIGILAQLPAVLTIQEVVLDGETVWQTLQCSLKTALDQLDTAKQSEGAVMFEDINQRLQSIQLLTKEIKSASVDLVEGARAKLQVRLNELFEGRVEIDSSRLVMEAGVIASRSDITEELVRLDSHCSQFAEVLKITEPVGKQLDFLLQEMIREVNTISSKASIPSISSTCVSLKTEIEKIRELIQNVE